MIGILLLFSQERGYIQTERGVEVMVQVWGEVRNPGIYYLPLGSTPLELISAAGGPTRYAKLSKVVLIRGEGKERKIVVDIDGYVKGKNMELPVLRGGDIIIVPANVWYIFSRIAILAGQVAAVVGAIYLIREW